MVRRSDQSVNPASDQAGLLIGIEIVASCNQATCFGWPERPARSGLQPSDRSLYRLAGAGHVIAFLGEQGLEKCHELDEK